MNQLVIWEGCIVGKDRATEFETKFQEWGFKVKYRTEYETLPSKGDPNTGGRNDLLFSISDKDIPKFAIWRLQHGMRWWEDYLDGGGKSITPEDVLKQYPNGWVKKQEA